jgi:hypothetical protein
MNQNKYGYFIRADNPTVKVRLAPAKYIDLSFKNLIELVLPECKEVRCYNNKLTNLIVPNGCKFIMCCKNNLNKLVLPIGCETVYCSNNNLTELIIPEGCEYVSCINNQLNKLIIPKACKEFNFDNNNLPQVIEKLFLSRNSIKMQLANSLQFANIKKN